LRYEKYINSDLTVPRLSEEQINCQHEVVTEKQKEWAHLTDHEIRQIIAGYYGMVEMADYYVGMLLDGLDALAEDREDAEADIEFAYIPGSQWDEDVKRNRAGRPSLEYNKVPAFINRVKNAMR